MKKLKKLLLTTFFVFPLSAGHCFAAVIHVPGDQPNIQSGIDAALNGDTVLTADGVYSGEGNRDLDFCGKEITVMSANGSTYSVLDCEFQGRGAYFHNQEGPGSVFSGFTILHGSCSSRGSGIFCEAASPTVTDCLITACSSNTCGGGMAFSQSSAEVGWCRIIANWADSSGGGVSCSASAAPVLTDCIISGNAARRLGAGICCDYAWPVLERCIITGNETHQYSMENCGGGLHCYNSSPVIIDCLFSNNQALVHGGAISLYYASSPTITGTAFSGNAASFGGAICCMDSSSVPFIGNAPEDACYFQGNRAGSGADLYRPGVYAQPVMAEWNVFAGYFPSDYYVTPQVSFDLENCTSELEPITQDVYVSPYGNDDNSGLSYCDPFRTIHHACSMILGSEDNPITIHLDSGTYTADWTGERFPLPVLPFVTLQGWSAESTILDAEGINMGIAAIFDNDARIREVTVRNGYGSWGGGIYCLESYIDIIGCRITDCYGRTGGGICCARYAAPLITECMIDNNTAEACGGGIACELASPVITDCVIIDNNATAVYPYFISGYGDAPGAVDVKQAQFRMPRAFGAGLFFGIESAPQVSNCLIAGNVSSDYAGGLYSSYGSTGILTNCTFTENSAELSGGGVMSYNSPLTLTNCILWNDAPEEIIVQSGDIEVCYCNVEGGFPGTGNIDVDPLFVAGSLGGFYLSQTVSGQASDSPCLDAGSELAGLICFPGSAGEICLDMFTTRTDHVTDASTVDMGFHYLPAAIPTPFPTQPATPEPSFTPIPSDTPVPVTNPPTETPLTYPSASPATTATLIPTQISPTFAPTATHPVELGVRLLMPADHYCPGDSCWLNAILHNHTESSYNSCKLFVLLDIGMGYYWFHPEWKQYPPELSWTVIDHWNPGVRCEVILSNFTWPDDCGQLYNLQFFGAVTDQNVSEMIGEPDSWSFGYSE